MITIDMGKARDIKRSQLRAERASRLAALDVEVIRAIERGDQGTASALAERKQRLRDVTRHKAISAAKTPDALAALSIDNLI